MSGEHPSAVSGAFGMPFSEQVAFFRQKLGNLVPTQFWDDMLGAEHDRGFMVAGAMKVDLLTDLAAAVDKAISEGRGIEEFRRDFRAIVARHGWTGWTGEGSVKGEAWRVRTILSTNAYTSYSAGRYAQLKARNFPLWVYRHGDSKEPRPQHLDWDGLILPSDHEFWDVFYPPSDWGCSCRVAGARSQRGAIRLGGDPSKKLADDWRAIDPKTGVPFGAGKGWNYAPGKSVASTVQALAGKVRHWDYAIAKAFMESLPAARGDELAEAYRTLPSTADDARRYAQRVLDPTPGLPPPALQRTLGMVLSGQAAEIKRVTGTEVVRFDFSIDPSAIRHARAAHGDAAREAARGQRVAAAVDFARVPELLLAGARFEAAGTSWRTGQKLVRVTRRIGDETWIAVFEIRTGRKTLALDSLVISGVGQR